MAAAAIYSLADAADPTKEMLARIGSMADIDLAGARVLVWIYVSPRKSKGGIILTDKSKQEDIWQGCVGYVLKCGPLAFKNDKERDFGGFSVNVDDWVTFTPGEGKRVQIKGVDCRIIEDTLIQSKIARPDIITHE